jgi:hypothetical protein
MSRYVFYKEDTGELYRVVKILSGVSVANNTPEGYKALKHREADPRKHKVVFKEGKPVVISKEI